MNALRVGRETRLRGVYINRRTGDVDLSGFWNFGRDGGLRSDDFVTGASSALLFGQAVRERLHKSP